MKTGTPKLFLALIVPLLLSALTMHKAAAQASVSNFIFKQYDRYDANGSLLFANSSLGSVSVSPVNTTTQTYYLNIYAKTQSGDNAWMVKNYPLPARTLACQQIEVDYKYLDIAPGNPVSTVQYNYTVTNSLVVAQAQTDTIIIGHHDTVKDSQGDHDISDHDVAWYNNYNSARVSKNRFHSFNQLSTMSGIGVNPAPVATAYVVKDEYMHEASGAYSEFLNYAISETKMPIVDTPIGHDVPPVQEDSDQCSAGAYARSIAWLNDKYKLNYPKTPQQIYDSLKKRFDDSCKAGGYTVDCKIAVKSNFLKSISGGKGITSITVIDTTWKITPPGVPVLPRAGNPANWIKDNIKDCDVELSYTYREGGKTKAHIITITKIVCDNAGCCTIWYRDDDKQGNPNKGDSCQKSIKLCNGTDTFRVNGALCKIWYMVKECVTAGGRMSESVTPATVTVAVPIALLQNTPNPFGSSTTIGIQVQEGTKVGVAQLIIRNAQGNEVQRIRLNLKPGLNNIPYQRGRDAKGLLYYSLQVDGQTIATRQMMTELQ